MAALQAAAPSEGNSKPRTALAQSWAQTHICTRPGELHTPKYHQIKATLQETGRALTVPGDPGERPLARLDNGSTKSLRNLPADLKSCISRGNLVQACQLLQHLQESLRLMVSQERMLRKPHKSFFKTSRYAFAVLTQAGEHHLNRHLESIALLDSVLTKQYNPAGRLLTASV